MPKATDAATDCPGRGFSGALWQKEINVRAFIQLNYTPYDGERAFLAPATARTQKIWEKLTALFVEERKKGVLDISQIPSSITAHAPGYIDREHEVIVGLQTDAPLKRAIMPNGGFRMVLSALKTYGYKPDPHVVESVHQVPEDAQRGRVRRVYRRHPRCRSSHVLTGLPDAYGRGRIIGDYRRVALYGVDRLIEQQEGGEAALDSEPSTEDDHPRPRGTVRADPGAAGTEEDGRELRVRHLAARPAPRSEAVQWLYFGYLAAVKEQNGAAMSLGRCSTFLDIYFERDLAAGR